MKDTCLVLVTNYSFFDKLINTLSQITSYNFTGDICLVIGDDLVDSDKLNHPLLKDKNVIIKHFTDIVFSDEFNEKFNNIPRLEHWRKKKFQYHKLHLFNTFFKQWKKIFYIDAGMNVFSSIQPIIDVFKEGKFLAHSDAYPAYTYGLEAQFVKEDSIFSTLSQKYNFYIDFPQTTIMLFDSDIIEDNTFENLIHLAEECKISITNDQGIIALYFTNIKPCWEQIQLGDEKTWYYDYLLRPEKMYKPHIMLKQV